VDLPIKRGDFSSSLCGCLPEGKLSLQKLDLPADHPICERQVSGQESELLLLQRLDVPADTFWVISWSRPANGQENNGIGAGAFGAFLKIRDILRYHKIS
jgi:hypothetical protein